jgi:hypothetical protein
MKATRIGNTIIIDKNLYIIKGDKLIKSDFTVTSLEIQNNVIHDHMVGPIMTGGQSYYLNLFANSSKYTCKYISESIEKLTEMIIKDME